MKRIAMVMFVCACHSQDETHGERKQDNPITNSPTVDTTPSATATDVPTVEMPTITSAMTSATPSPPTQMSGAVIARTMRANAMPLKACYERALAKNPSLSGRVSMRFSIDAKGNVTSAAADPAKTTLRDPSVSSCLATEMKKIHFPESSSDTTATWPFTFSGG